MKKYLNFHYSKPTKPTTLRWIITSVSTDEDLGYIEWYVPWRQYCYYPMNDLVFSVSCLREIADFIENHRTDRIASELCIKRRG